MLDSSSFLTSQTWPVARSLEEAHLSGDLNLSGRKLKEFPFTGKYSLMDIVTADLSKNRFNEFPLEVTEFWCLEHLNLYCNMIRLIPDSLSNLQSLTYLDLSRNQLCVLPDAIFELSLESLLLSNNKLQKLPLELGQCKTLMELSVSCNQLTHLPAQLGQLTLLKYLDVRNNLLLELPLELSSLHLTYLDISQNRLSSLPKEMRNMSSLETLDLSNNPLVAPPSTVCMRGLVHVFKWLELRCTKEEKYRVNNGGKVIKKQSFNGSGGLNKPFNIVTSEKTIDHPSEYMYLQTNKQNSNSKQVLQLSVPEQNKLISSHPQTYKEYKESLRQQRHLDMYKLRQENNLILNIKPNSSQNSSTLPVSKLNMSIDIPSFVTTTTATTTTTTTIINTNSSITDTTTLTLDGIYKPQFTMRREFEKAKEEAELLKQLRKDIETHLKILLPEDLSSAFCDGIVLCHLANYVQPHAVTSIHVPSPTVPKLTMARCRKNVDNFLQACQKIGVKKNLICNAQDILEGRGNVQIAVTVAELLRLHS